jgi:GNAT superfamily N-acetyltransferase
MDVRQAEAADLAACAALSASVQSTHVWQLRLAHDPIAGHSENELGATLHRTRLPRPIVVQPASDERFDQLWTRAADVLVADDGEQVVGYTVLTIDSAAPAVTIARLAVAPAVRHQGVGGLLLRTSAQWGGAMGLTRLAGHCSARNDPAARFFMRWGMRFAGYSEARYPHGEVALFWQRPL